MIYYKAFRWAYLKTWTGLKRLGGWFIEDETNQIANSSRDNNKIFLNNLNF